MHFFIFLTLIINKKFIKVFVKVVTLVVSLGLFHGLIVLPIIFAWIPFKKKIVFISTPSKNSVFSIIINNSLDDLSNKSLYSTKLKLPKSMQA